MILLLRLFLLLACLMGGIQPDSTTVTYHYDESSLGIGYLTSATAGNVTQNW